MAIPEIQKDIVRAVVTVRFEKIEKQAESGTEAIYRDAGEKGFTNKWIERKEKASVGKYSAARNVRLDFNLRNVHLDLGKPNKKGEFEYHLFSLTWPIFCFSSINKQSGKGIYSVYSNVSTRNSKVLVEGKGYYFLQNALISDYFGNETEQDVIDKFEDDKLLIKILNTSQTIESAIKTKEVLSVEKNNIEGHCVYGGSLVWADRGALWYPFDKYYLDLTLSFPFKEVDLDLKLEKPEDFIINFEGWQKTALDNYKITPDSPLKKRIILSRKNPKFLFLGVFLPLILTLLPNFFSGTPLFARCLAYVGAVFSIYFGTVPPDNVMWLYPMRFFLFAFNFFAILICEYIHWIKLCVNK